MEEDTSLTLGQVNSREKVDENLRLNWIDYLRMIAVFAVVVVHVSVSFISNKSLGSFQWWIGSAADAASIWCIPVFIMISGFLFLDPGKNFNTSSFYRSRIRRLLIPVLFWTLLSLVSFIVIGYIENEPLSVFDIVDKVISGKPYYHLWYLYMLSSLLLFTPYIRKLVEVLSTREVKILCIILFSYAIISNIVDKFYFGQYSQARLGDTFFINWFLLYLGYYIAGYLIGNSKIQIKSGILWLILFSAVFATVGGCYLLAQWTNIETGLFFYGYLSPTVVIAAFCIILIIKNLRNTLPQSRLVNSLSTNSLGIYLFHPYFLTLLYIFGIEAYKFNPIVSIPLMSIGVFSISYLSTEIVKRIPYLRRIV